MDANNNKTLAGALVALLVGSAFLAMIPTASADNIFGATADPDVIVDARVTDTATFNATTIGSGISPVVQPADTKIRVNSSYDIRVVGLDVGQTTGYGYIGSTESMILVNPSGSTIASSTLETNGTGDLRNATFLSVKPTLAGVYEVRAANSGNVAAKIIVYPADILTVTITPSSVAYQTSPLLFTVTVTNASGAVPDALVWSTAGGSFLSGGSRTNSVGQLQFFSTPAGAGVFNISASRDFAPGSGGDGIPEESSNTTLTITGLALTVTAINTTANVGFNQPISFRPTYADGSAVFGSSPSITPTRVNISMTNGSTIFWHNVSFPGSTTSATDMSCGSGATGGDCPSTTAGNPDIVIERGPAGYVTITPTVAWSSGTYTINVAVHTAGDYATTSPEYTGSMQFAPATPANVNLQVSPTKVDVPAYNTNDPPTGFLTSSVNGQAITLTVSGSTQSEHPTDSSTSWDAFTTANITVTGDVLPGYEVTAGTAGDGIYTITGIWTRNGSVTVNVAWKNATTSIVVPVDNGAVITASVTNMTVDQTTTITVNVKNAFGGAVENAQVYVFKRGATPTTTGGAFSGTGTQAIGGTGAPNVGQGGNYVFSLRPDAVQDLVFAAKVGTNYTYVPVSVVPSQNLTVTLTNGTSALTGTMAALRTPILVNATNETGIGLLGTAANYQVHFLNAAQVRNLQNNGTNAFGTDTDDIPTSMAASTVVSTSSSAGSWLNYTQTSANDYWVYVCASSTSLSSGCSTAKYDNRLNLVPFNVSRYTATLSPTQIASSRDIGANTTVMVTITDTAGNLPNGTLRILGAGTATTLVTDVSPAALNASTGTTVTNGVVNVTLTGVGTIGNVWFEFDPKETTGTETDADGLVDGNLSITPGNIVFSPSKVPILQSTLVTVNLQNFTGAGLPGRVIRLCGVGLNPNFPSTFPTTLDSASSANCSATDVTQADGSAGIVVSPNSLQPLGIYVNGSYTGKQIPVIAGTLSLTHSPAAPSAGDTVTLTASQANQPSAGINVRVTRDGVQVLNQTTDSQGRVVLTNVTAGNYTAVATRSGFENGTDSWTVGGAGNVSGARFVLSNLVVPDTVNVGQAITVSADIENTGTADGTANAILLVNNAQRGTQSVFVAAGDKETVAYDFTPTVAGTYQVTVRLATGETLASETVTVGTPTTPVTTGTPATTTTTVTGTTPATVTTTPTTTPTTEPTPRVPGFEVVALIAALGVALLVLNRRK